MHNGQQRTFVDDRYAATGWFIDRYVEGPDEADSGAVTLIQRFGCTVNLNIHHHHLVGGH